jgi:hypothetical protein
MSFSLKLCMPCVNRRGAGLGNELIPWARAFVAGAVLGVQTLPPAFGLNQRKYWRHFGTPKTDWLTHRLIAKALPCFEFTESDFYKYDSQSLSNAVRLFAEEHKLAERSSWVLTTKGMWGGYRHVIEAREFVRSTLYLSKFAAINLTKIKARLNPKLITVGMHVRLGDFQPIKDLEEYRGNFNTSLPLQWYINIAQSIRQQLGDKVQFLVVSDGTAEQLAPLLNQCNAITTLGIPDSDISDMLALAEADLLVCSVSSYSAWAAFLSNKPYLWFEPNLQNIGGYYSIWGHESRQQSLDGYTMRARKEIEASSSECNPRGLPVAMNGAISPSLLQSLSLSRSQFQLANDLVNYGVMSAGKLK